MTLSAHFRARDFTSPILTGLQAEPLRLDWSVYGGPDRAEIKLTAGEGKLLQAARLLRSPVMIRDRAASPVWWGYVEKVDIFLSRVQFSVSMDTLYNQVSVRYTFISPDNVSGDVAITERADDIPSQRDYGIKEIILQREGIDDDFAESLRDAFLKISAQPKTTLSQREDPGGAYALVKCAGWFKTLAWQSYENKQGFYANTGSGPGIFTFGQSTSYQNPSQVFTPGASGRLKYAYFQLRGVGSPIRDLNAQLHDGTGTLLATSEGVPGTILSATAYRWVRFTFDAPYALAAGAIYMIGVTGNTPDPARYFAIRTDENQGYQNGYGCYFNGASWVNLPSITNPGGAPDLLFRALCISDTGLQLSDIAAAGNQFFTKIGAPETGVLTCPYRENEGNCLEEVQNLMALGTAAQRRILARVTPERQLEFYEQPNPENPSIYINERGQFFTFQGTPLKPHFPPVGQFARYLGSSLIMDPFDKDRIPVCFIERASYWPKRGKVVIN